MDSINWKIKDYVFNKDETYRAQYIFEILKRFFPEIIIDERENIIGIGEKGYRLMCYFIINDNNVYVKFQSFKKILLLTNLTEIDRKIKSTISLYRTNKENLLLTVPNYICNNNGTTSIKTNDVDVKKYTYDSTLTAPILIPILTINQVDMKHVYTYSLNISKLNVVSDICETSEEIFNRIIDNKRKFEHTYYAINNFIYQLAVYYGGKRNADIFVKRYYTDKSHSLGAIGVEYGLTRERVRQLCERISKKITLGTKRAFMTNKYAILNDIGLENYFAFMICCKQNSSSMYFNFLRKSIFDFINEKDKA